MRTTMTVLATTTLLGSMTGPALPGDRVTGQPFATRSEVLAPRAMAATSQPLATQVALDVLRDGGNAVDAAIAANAAQALMEPTGCGIGGDLYALVWSAEDRRLYGLNGSGRSPLGQSLEDLRAKLGGADAIPAHGVLPVTVPGCVDGWFTLHGRFGSKPMAELLAPTVRYAREGWPVTDLIAYYWKLSAPRLAEQPGFADTFLRDGRAPEAGEPWTNPGLADTLERLGAADAERPGAGRDLFYEGDLAETMVTFLREHGSAFTIEDFAAHRSEWVEPVSTTYRGARLWELPPNGQGIAALQILNLLEPYDLAAWGHGSADYVHAFVEAKKLAFADRARLYADAAFVVDHDALVERLISKAYADERRAGIDPERVAVGLTEGLPLPETLEQGDTIYLCTADEQGNMVSLIQSNYRGMGAGVCPPGLGFGFQDRGELFDLTPGRPNSYAPGKRPFHTIIPAFVTLDDGGGGEADVDDGGETGPADAPARRWTGAVGPAAEPVEGVDPGGAPWIAYGVMGGATQPQAHAQVLIHLLDFGMNLQEAGDAARILHTGSAQPTGQAEAEGGGYVSLESAYGPEVRAELERRGHRFRARPGAFGGYQAILRDPATGMYHGASESRKDGHAAGF